MSLPVHKKIGEYFLGHVDQKTYDLLKKYEKCYLLALQAMAQNEAEDILQKSCWHFGALYYQYLDLFKKQRYPFLRFFSMKKSPLKTYKILSKKIYKDISEYHKNALSIDPLDLYKMSALPWTFNPRQEKQG